MKDDHSSHEAQSKKILEDVKRDSESVGASSLARATELHNRNRYPEDDADDPVVILGKKIGRGLGWAAMIVLVIYLVTSYIL